MTKQDLPNSKRTLIPAYQPLNYKENTINKSIKFVIEDDLNKEALIDENLIFIFESNSSANNNTLFLNHLNLKP